MTEQMERPAPARARRLAAIVAVASALSVAAFGVVKGTWAVGGSDSSCYGLMAEAFANGKLQPTSPFTGDAPWPDGPLTFAPAGFIPSPMRMDGASPICAPGFALLLAPVYRAAGPDAIFIVTPLAGALLVWLTFRFAAAIAGPVAGAAAAVIAATTPVLLFQVVQPMNDILAAALWMAVLVAASAPDPTRAWVVGALAGCGILVRPNLAPLGVVVGAWLALTSYRARGGTGALAARNVVGFVLAAAPFLLVLGMLNNSLYGHPAGSGYGNAQQLFALEHVPDNARFYGSAIIATQLGFPLLGLIAPVAAPRAVRPLVWLALPVSAATVAVYLLYVPFHEWWYLRFLLPAIVPMTALAAATLVWWLPAGRVLAAVGALIVAALAGFGVAAARDRQVFDLQRLERRFRTTSDIVRDRLPANSVFLTVWQSGTLRFHAHRQTMMWDSLDPDALDTAIAWFSAKGLDPFIVIEQWEEPRFRERFSGHTALGALDWPPRFEIEHQVRIFNPTDRARYLQGGETRTEYIIRR